VSKKFPKMQRLLRRQDFQNIRKSAKRRYCGKQIIIEFCENAMPFSRLGISVSKKFGKSYQRNRFKRIVREAYRLNSFQIPAGIDIHVRPRKFALAARQFEIEIELKEAVRAS